MPRRELTIPAGAGARDALMAACAFVKRSQIEDAYYARPDGALARLRRQDMMTRLSCTAPTLAAAEERAETVVLDASACQRLLAMLGFERGDTIKLTRETWNSHHYVLHFDRVRGLGEFITIETESGPESPHKARRQALAHLKKLGIPSMNTGVDNRKRLPYTASIVSAAPVPT